MSVRGHLVLALVIGLAGFGAPARAEHSPDHIPLAYEDRADLDALRKVGLRTAEALATGLDGTFAPTPITMGRLSSLIENEGYAVCAVMHARTPEREKTRQWVAKLINTQVAVAGTDAALPAPGPNDGVAVLAGTPFETLARSSGFRTEPVRTRAQITAMFRTGRVRYWLDEKSVFKLAAEDGTIPGFAILRDMGEVSGWVACSKAVPKQAVEALRAQVEKIRADGTLRQIILDYGWSPEAMR